MALGEVAGASSVALGLGGGGGGAAAFIERAVVELEEHVVRSWETRETNALEEPEAPGGRRAVL